MPNTPNMTKHFRTSGIFQKKSNIHIVQKIDFKIINVLWRFLWPAFGGLKILDIHSKYVHDQIIYKYMIIQNINCILYFCEHLCEHLFENLSEDSLAKAPCCGGKRCVRRRRVHRTRVSSEHLLRTPLRRPLPIYEHHFTNTFTKTFTSTFYEDLYV